MPQPDNALTDVPYWRITALRIVYLLIVLGLSSFVWQQLLFEAAELATMTGIAKAMMATLVILSLFGLRYPLDLLPVLIFELVWKMIWMLLIALPAALDDRWTSSTERVFFECAGVVVLFVIIPWRHVWARWFTRPGEPWLPTNLPEGHTIARR
ncbi:hypothetical protein [uncultured Microbulbifer sp.]|uniref:hypothetical protein n=1 Tax=uncultured Microbulbifer sp. TaxID=348147 RepID=UPI00260E0FE3|nr:hypothetical protein [uncultured Microbulbifer sp.]